MSSTPLPSVCHLGYEWFSATQSRPRSSMAKAIGCTMSGSPANSVALKPGGSVIFWAATRGGSGASCAWTMATEDSNAAMARRCFMFVDRLN